MEEQWKPIEGYHGLYMVSDKGRIWSCKTNRILKQNLSVHGYLRVNLSSNGIKKHHAVHRLVAQAFLENPKGLPEVNHIDEVKTNNLATNLEWCTRQYNSDYTLSVNATLVSPEGITVEVHNITKFAAENNLTLSSVSRLIRGERKSHKGWTLNAEDSNPTVSDLE